MEIMKPIASVEIPRGEAWLYEVKYDGFRCVLQWDKDKITLTSRNNKDLTTNFPEIVDYCQSQQSLVSKHLPLTLDGELAILNNNIQANFSWIQKRGRLKSVDSIRKASEDRPATFLVFDLLGQKGKSYLKKAFADRKSLLKELFALFEEVNFFRYISAYENPDELWQTVFDFKGEGIIAKRKKSSYSAEKNHHDWFKIKNWRTIHGFLTYLNVDNGYFTVCVYEDGKVKEIGTCKHGLDKETFQTLKQIFTTKGEKVENGYKLPPAICAAVHTLDLHQAELREPNFAGLLPQITPKECTLEKLNLDMAMIPTNIDLTNTAKTFWPFNGLTKGDLLIYIRKIAPYMLPFLKEKALTLIRSPDGVENEYFFQKHLPDYAPSFINSFLVDEERLIVCDRLNALVWFANHGAVEYHIPFQTISHTQPDEIVFDLDPPDRTRFDLAIKAAQIIKPMLDDLELISFVKTSGNKGLQIHIPILPGSMTYDQTALFTQAIAWTVENAYSSMFTTERLKKNRGGRLYIDYVQHGKDKTLIAPYSPRKTDEATVATPLLWEEVVEGLRPEQFTIMNVVERVQEFGCPFAGYFKAGKEQKLDKVLELVE